MIRVGMSRRGRGQVRWCERINISPERICKGNQDTSTVGCDCGHVQSGAPAPMLMPLVRRKEMTVE